MSTSGLNLPRGTSATSVTPGTAATNLGKAEDAAHASGDVGVEMLSVRQDTATPLAGTTGDYQPLSTDAFNALRVLLMDALGAAVVYVGNAGTSRSITTSTSSQTLMASNASRAGFEVKNDTTIDVWVNFGGTATAVAGGDNVKVAANGGSISQMSGMVCTAALTIIAASGTPAIHAREY